MLKKILFVEPDYVWQDILDRHLSDWGFSVHFYSTGRNALSQIPALRPILAVVELDLPDMDGFELVRGLRANEDLAGLPIIILTHLEERKFVELALESSINEYLLKSEHTPAQIVQRIVDYAGS